MFTPIAVEVDSRPEGVFFLFPEPVSVILFTVTNALGEELWAFDIFEGQPVAPQSSSMSLTPLDQASPELLAQLVAAQRQAQTQLKAQGLLKPVLSRVQCGVLPSGYLLQHAAAVLAPGSYRVIVQSWNGTGTTEFNVP